MNHQQDHACLGPHCQCSFLAGRAQSRDPQRVVVPISGPARSRPGGAARAAHVSLPAWVLNSPPGAVTPHGGSCGVLGPVGHAQAAVTPAPLRFHWRSREAPNAADVDQRGKFRDRIRVEAGGHISRCLLPESVPLVFADLDDALLAAGDFLNALAAEEDKVFGQEGTNAGMARALRAMCTCFDWGRLVGDGLVPTVNDLAEFKVLAPLLEPYLRFTEWPSKEDFPEVTHGWPDLDELQVQYVVLMNRLRAAASKPRFRHSWWSVTGYYISFCFAPGAVHLRLQRPRPGGAMGVVVSYCCHRVQHVGPRDRRSGRSDSTGCSGSTQRLFDQRSPLGSLRRSLAEPEAPAPTEAERQGGVGFPAGARQRGRPSAARTRRPSGPRDADRARAGLVGCERLG
jgi:hypothetical protein